MTTRRFLLAGLLVALLLAGFASYYASSHPDGLNHVAEKAGFIDQDSTEQRGPFAGYETRGVDDERISGGIAGVAGVLMVGLIGGGLFWALRRRPSGRDDAEAAEATEATEATAPSDSSGPSRGTRA